MAGDGCPMKQPYMTSRRRRRVLSGSRPVMGSSPRRVEGALDHDRGGPHDTPPDGRMKKGLPFGRPFDHACSSVIRDHALADYSPAATCGSPLALPLASMSSPVAWSTTFIDRLVLA